MSYNLLKPISGLAYLHGSCNPRIVHMDVKSSNILLSKTMEGKMSDFGISRQNSVDDGVQVTSKLIASRGYVDPEYAILRSRCTYKTIRHDLTRCLLITSSLNHDPVIRAMKQHIVICSNF